MPIGFQLIIAALAGFIHRLVDWPRDMVGAAHPIRDLKTNCATTHPTGSRVEAIRVSNDRSQQCAGRGGGKPKPRRKMLRSIGAFMNKTWRRKIAQDKGDRGFARSLQSR